MRKSKWNVYHVNKEMKHVNMQMPNSVSEKEVIIYWNAMDQQFLSLYYIVEQVNWVNRGFSLNDSSEMMFFLQLLSMKISHFEIGSIVD